MRKNAWLKVVNPLLLLAAVVQAITGLGMMLFGWEAVHELHETSGLVFVALVVVHVILNWRWFVGAYRRRA
jgi:heme/copper-type cytochrome/quinol oxidase subunit 4